MTLLQTRNYTSIIVFAIFTCYLVFSDRANVFFLIYIFWWDEFLKTIFTNYSLIFQKQYVKNPTDLKQKIKGRYFMLFVYYIFIVIIFGFVISFRSDDVQNLVNTFRILVFRDWAFDSALIFILIREVSNLVFRDKEQKITGKHLSIGALITLHVSIIFGMLLWTVASGKFMINKTDYGSIADQLIILPFIFIKLIFDLYQFKYLNK